jgi:hypothetical protein
MMNAPSREFATSSNGDRWCLELDEASGVPHIVHQANLPSGGAITRMELGDFLRRQDSPERQALVVMIGTLVGQEEPVEATQTLRPRWTD